MIELVQNMRGRGLEAYASIDAGPNVFVNTTGDQVDEVKAELSRLKGIRRVIGCKPAGKPEMLARG